MLHIEVEAYKPQEAFACLTYPHCAIGGISFLI